MQLEDHLGDGPAQVEALVRAADVERPPVGVVLVGLLAEVEGDGAVGYREAGGCIFDAAVVVRHRLSLAVSSYLGLSNQCAPMPTSQRPRM